MARFSRVFDTLSAAELSPIAAEHRLVQKLTILVNFQAKDDRRAFERRARDLAYDPSIVGSTSAAAGAHGVDDLLILDAGLLYLQNLQAKRLPDPAG